MRSLRSPYRDRLLLNATRSTDPRPAPVTREHGLLEALVGDGRPALSLTAVALFLSGAFAVFLAARREFLPHDVAYLQMTAEQLCGLADCRIVHFMFHDRVAFGGTLIAVAILYFWLIAFPLREGLLWAWWTLVVTGTLGFGSFLLYLGYGYLDSWHGAGTAALLPVFVLGMWVSRRHATRVDIAWMRRGERQAIPTLVRRGRWGILATGAGLTLAGAVIMYLGTTEVFVSEDLAFMGLSREAINAISDRLIPLIAHDRAGFGGGLTTVGVLLLMCGWHAAPSRAFHQAILAAGTAGFGFAIGTHFAEGYLNPVHLAPAILGAGLFLVSVLSERAGWRRRAAV